MAQIISGVPNIVIFAGGAFAVYWFFIREDPDKKKAEDGRRRVLGV